MNYKKFMSLFIVIAVLLCMTACSGGKGGTVGAENNTTTTTNVTEKSDIAPETTGGREDTETTEGTKPQIPELKYKMAPVYKRTAENHKYGYTELWFVFECENAGWIASFTNGFTITNTATGEVLNDLEDPYYGGAKIEMYRGSVCYVEHKSDLWDYSIGYEVDYSMYTFCITSATDINFEDLSVVGNFTYLSPDVYVDEDSTFDLEFNSSIEDITTRQKFIHGSTLFGIDGKYYVCNASSFGGGGNAETLDFSLLQVIGISGTMDDLANSLKGKTHYVYGPDARYYEESGYSSDEDYLKVVETPSHCIMHIEASSEEDVEIGYRAKEGYTLSAEDSALVNSTIPVYTFEDGFEMTFINES